MGAKKAGEPSANEINPGTTMTDQGKNKIYKPQKTNRSFLIIWLFAPGILLIAWSLIVIVLSDPIMRSFFISYGHFSYLVYCIPISLIAGGIIGVLSFYGQQVRQGKITIKSKSIGGFIISFAVFAFLLLLGFIWLAELLLATE